MIDLSGIERDLTAAYAGRLERVRRRRRRSRAIVVVVAVAGVFTSIAAAGGLGLDLQLDPTKWTVLGGGSTDNGRGAYVHAARIEDGSHSTFMVEHDAGLAPYDAFLLHEQTKAAADATSPVPVQAEPGPLCTPAQLTHAEVVALQALRPFPRGTPASATKEAADEAVADDFGDTPCRGLEYAGEQARLVYAGAEPPTLLMPGAR
jgi:hypothetical protein